MRIGIIGAGALGGTFAALLARAGHDVEVTARGSGLEAIRADGIRLSGGYGDTHAHVAASEALTERPELVLLCTKAQDAPLALGRHAELIDGVPVVVVQNGLDGVQTAERFLPHSTCVGVLSIIAANYTEPGVVRVTTTAASYLGRGDGPADDESRRIAAILSEAVPVIAIENFRGSQWTKLVVNMLNAVPAIVGRSVQEVLGDRRLRRVVAASMRETVRVGIARGIRFGSLQGLSNARLRLFARMPVAIGQVLPWMMGVRMGNVPNLGSTQQSVRRGQPTEVDHLNGAVVREAILAELDAPVNEALTVLVHEVERIGEFLPAERVLAEVPHGGVSSCRGTAASGGAALRRPPRSRPGRWGGAGPRPPPPPDAARRGSASA